MKEVKAEREVRTVKEVKAEREVRTVREVKAEREVRTVREVKAEREAADESEGEGDEELVSEGEGEWRREGGGAGRDECIRRGARGRVCLQGCVWGGSACRSRPCTHSRTHMHASSSLVSSQTANGHARTSILVLLSLSLPASLSPFPPSVLPTPRRPPTLPAS